MRKLDLNSLAVSAKYQRRGIGQMLVKWGMERAREEGKGIILIANPAGAPLYQKLGFEEIGETMTFVGEPWQQRERFLS